MKVANQSSSSIKTLYVRTVINSNTNGLDDEFDAKLTYRVVAAADIHKDKYKDWKIEANVSNDNGEDLVLISKEK
jgi:hypothetical protein